jgi:hypothetical protein
VLGVSPTHDDLTYHYANEYLTAWQQEAFDTGDVETLAQLQTPTAAIRVGAQAAKNDAVRGFAWSDADRSRLASLDPAWVERTHAEISNDPQAAITWQRIAATVGLDGRRR